MMKQMFSVSKIFSSDIDDLLIEVDSIRTNKKIEYMNVSCAFDIESTSFINEDDEKTATMYAWVFGINGKCVLGRTWQEFIKLLKKITDFYALNDNRRMIVYIHNLAYEFQFFRKLFQFKKVFALENRKPVVALTTTGIEFRCSYLLSGYSLANVANNLTKYKVSKMVGDLDYSLPRHSTTYLTEKELGYILNDGLVVMAYIQEQIEKCGDITKIPLTKTGFVRRYCRNMCLYEGGHSHNVLKYKKYHNLMCSMQIVSVSEYDQLKRAFMGGFTHANAHYVGKTVHDVTSYDFTSSYPSVMITEQFPMSTGELIEIHSKEEFIKNIKLYCCLFDITFYNLESRTSFEHPLSVSKCFHIKDMITDNGRIVESTQLSTTVTEQDFLIFRKFYKWSKISIRNFRRYNKGYLPTDFVKAILKLYSDKTTLKNVDEKIVEYMNSKEMLNACYGMSVTDICRNESVYDGSNPDVWINTLVDKTVALKKYNLQKNRFLSYPWGVWVTAYARRNLFTGIYACGDDYIYADTDSIKIRHANAHMDYINDYNRKIENKLLKACEFHQISVDLVKPKTIKNVEKILGVWDFDGHYNRFKTLGAKRYMVETDDGKISFTISGVNKKYGVPYLQQKYGDKIFEHFNDGLVFPKEYYNEEQKQTVTATGKNVHTYIDDERSGVLVDYRGKLGSYKELSSIHIDGSDYELGLSSEFIRYLQGYIEKYD